MTSRDISLCFAADKPSDWDDDEDGEWEAPLVPNPKVIHYTAMSHTNAHIAWAHALEVMHLQFYR